MVIRRCPQCGTTSDDQYGFCYKCGFEFQKIKTNVNQCPLCGFENPDEADYCVKCGSPLIFKSQFQENNPEIKPIVIKKSTTTSASGWMKWLIVFGYLFSILGGLLGFIIAIYLVTRKDPSVRKHGVVQLAILLFYIILIAILYATGVIPPETVSNYRQLLAGNLTLP